MTCHCARGTIKGRLRLTKSEYDNLYETFMQTCGRESYCTADEWTQREFKKRPKPTMGGVPAIYD
jgi:hypothetical protein